MSSDDKHRPCALGRLIASVAILVVLTHVVFAALWINALGRVPTGAKAHTANIVFVGACMSLSTFVVGSGMLVLIGVRLTRQQSWLVLPLALVTYASVFSPWYLVSLIEGLFVMNRGLIIE